MEVLIACEESQTVTSAFRALGHDAYSCDILPCSGGHPEWHIEGDVSNWLASAAWDIVIAFPPCTDLAVSGSHAFAKKKANGSQQRSAEFFMQFTKLSCPFAIENPVGIMSTQYRKPDQVIQPHQFGHDASKKTCLWLNGLPLLTPTKFIPGKISPLTGRLVWGNQNPAGQNTLGESKARARLRSKTYPGIAAAMADQWTRYVQNNP